MKPYACHNGERPKAGELTHLAQEGYNPPKYVGDGRYGRQARYVPVLHVFTTACQYDQGATDQRCAGCKHIKPQGE